MLLQRCCRERSSKLHPFPLTHSLHLLAAKTRCTNMAIFFDSSSRCYLVQYTLLVQVYISTYKHFTQTTLTKKWHNNAKNCSTSLGCISDNDCPRQWYHATPTSALVWIWPAAIFPSFLLSSHHLFSVLMTWKAERESISICYQRAPFLSFFLSYSLYYLRLSQRKKKRKTIIRSWQCAEKMSGF